MSLRTPRRWRWPAVLLYAAPASANVIFPAFAAPYIAVALWPWLIVAVIAIETAVLYWRDRAVGIAGAFLAMSLANAASWIVGIVLASTLFPSGIAPGSPRPGSAFATLVWIAFPVALVLSIVIEAGVLALLSRWLRLRAPLRTALIANVGSYLVVAAAFLRGS